jgi:flagellar M-ring protein FliF
VTAEINFDRISTNEELFDPEGQVVRSTQTTAENGMEREPSNDNVSVENNLPGIGADPLTDQGPTAENNRNEEVTNFEISRTVRSTVREVGEIKKLSVAVLVDGTYSVNEEGVRTYAARPQTEIDQITALVKSAVGFDEKRGDSVEVINMQFADVMEGDDIPLEDKILGFDKADLLDAAEILTVAIMIILVVLLVLQPMVGRLMASETKEVEDDLEAELLGARPTNPALAAPSGDGTFNMEGDVDEELISISGVDGKVKASAVKKVEEIVDNYPAETVSVIRSWMTQEG